MGPCSAPRLLSQSQSVIHFTLSVPLTPVLGRQAKKFQQTNSTCAALVHCAALCTHAHAHAGTASGTGHTPLAAVAAAAAAAVAVAVAQLLLFAPAPIPAPTYLPASTSCTCTSTKFFSSLLGLRPTFSQPGSQNPRSPCPVGSIIRWCDFFILPHLYFPVVTWTRRKTGHLTPTGY